MALAGWIAKHIMEERKMGAIANIVSAYSVLSLAATLWISSAQEGDWLQLCQPAGGHRGRGRSALRRGVIPAVDEMIERSK